MTEPIVENSILQSIRKNGFPGKIVRLPFKSVFESCKQHGTPLNDVLKALEEENVLGEIHGDHIVFRCPSKNIPNPSQNKIESNFDFSKIEDVSDLENLGKVAQQYMSQISPEQMSEVRNMVSQMSDEEKAKIISMFQKTPKSP